MESDSNETKRSRKAVYVRFTEKELRRIAEDEINTGLSAAKLLKRRYFTGKSTQLLLPEQDKHKWYQELHQIRLAFERLTARIESNPIEGWYEEFSELSRTLTDLQTAITQVKYGRLEL